MLTNEQWKFEFIRKTANDIFFVAHRQKRKHLLFTRTKGVFFLTKSVLADEINPPSVDEIRLCRDIDRFNFSALGAISLKYPMIYDTISLINKNLTGVADAHKKSCGCVL